MTSVTEPYVRRVLDEAGIDYEEFVPATITHWASIWNTTDILAAYKRFTEHLDAQSTASDPDDLEDHLAYFNVIGSGDSPEEGAIPCIRPSIYP